MQMPRRGPAVVSLVVAAALSAAAALTTPFTWQADLVTALAFLVVVAGFVGRLVAEPRAAAALRTDTADHASVGRVAGWVPWAAVTAAVVAWELFSYLSSPRVAHPTLSSLANVLTDHPVTRGLVFLAYLALGWYLARR